MALFYPRRPYLPLPLTTGTLRWLKSIYRLVPPTNASMGLQHMVSLGGTGEQVWWFFPEGRMSPHWLG